MLAPCRYSCIGLLAVNEAQVEAESADDGVFEADPDLAVDDIALRRAS
jgi:hypothetical protein